jgi:hypothetical protein
MPIENATKIRQGHMSESDDAQGQVVSAAARSHRGRTLGALSAGPTHPPREPGGRMPGHQRRLLRDHPRDQRWIQLVSVSQGRAVSEMVVTSRRCGAVGHLTAPPVHMV